MTARSPAAAAPVISEAAHVAVLVRLKREVLDPQGRAVQRALTELGLGTVRDVRVGKLVELQLERAGRSDADLRAAVNGMAARLLANPVLEDFEVVVRGCLEMK